MQLKGKKLLVLGGAFQHCKIVETAKRLGIKAYVADYLEFSPAKGIADKSYQIDIWDIESLENLCQRESIDGIIATSLDPCQIPYQQLCERMKFPCFGTREQFNVLTNKRAFKECCQKYGIDTIQEYTLEQIVNGDSGVEFPVLVKPVDGRGSRGQTICRNCDEVVEAVKNAAKESSNGDVIIEKYMGNYNDFTMSYLFKNGDATLVRTGDRYQGSEKNGLSKIAIASASPSKYTELYLSNVHEKIVRMLKEIGIKNGPVFMQGFVDSNTIRFYDPGLRFAGGEYERLLYIICNVDLIKLLIEYALTGEIERIDIPSDICLLQGKRIMQLCPTLKPGTISRIEGIKHLKENPSVITCSLRYGVGDKISEQCDVRRRFAEICIISENKDKEIDNIHFVQNTIKVYDSNNKKMIFDSFKTKRLL